MVHRGWLTRAVLAAAAVLAGAACPAAAHAQDPAADASAGPFELVSGECLRGRVVGFYRPEGTPDGSPYLGIKLELENGELVFIPRTYFSDLQLYGVERRRLGDGEPGAPPADAMAWLRLARLALRAGPAVWAHARSHYERAIEIAGRDDDPRSTPEAMRQRCLEDLRDCGLHPSARDGRWVDEETYYREQGWKPWGGEWLPPAEYARRIAEAEARAKRDLSGLIERPEDYRRVQLALVRAFPGLYRRDAHGHWPRVRFFASTVRPPEAGFPPVGAFRPAAYRRLRVTDDDCAHVYLPAANTRLLQRAAELRAGDRIEVYGRLLVFDGLVVLECHGLALR